VLFDRQDLAGDDPGSGGNGHVDDEFELIEVRATTRVKETHIPDATFQTLVLSNAGTPPKRVLIGHVNNQFVLKEKDGYEGILVESDVTQEVMAYRPAAAAAADALLRVMARGGPPKIAVGDHCGTPYPLRLPDVYRSMPRSAPAGSGLSGRVAAAWREDDSGLDR
jgi:hypothetical protein